jgi:hypothetical protein
VYSITREALPAQIVSVLVSISISALEVVKRSVAKCSLAPICLLLGVEMVALTCLFLSGAEPMSHSGFVFGFVLNAPWRLAPKLFTCSFGIIPVIMGVLLNTVTTSVDC